MASPSKMSLFISIALSYLSSSLYPFIQLNFEMSLNLIFYTYKVCSSHHIFKLVTEANFTSLKKDKSFLLNWTIRKNYMDKNFAWNNACSCVPSCKLVGSLYCNNDGPIVPCNYKYKHRLANVIILWLEIFRFALWIILIF